MSNNPIPTQQIYFIDSAVSDSDILLAGLATDAVCYRLDANRDGLQQMADILAGYSGLKAIHVISHSSPGCLQLGHGWVTEDSLDGHRAALATIGGALDETGDLLLYGCDVAQGDVGQGFMAGLSKATGADVAGSDDLTGVGGDWVLEAQTGTVETDIGFTDLARQSYGGTLSLQSNTFNFAANDLNMWGAGDPTGKSYVWEISKTYGDSTPHPIDYLGFSADYALSFTAGIGAEFNATAGSVDVGYDLSVNASLPDTVHSGEYFIIDTSSWTSTSSLQSIGPSLNLDIYATFGIDASLTNIQYDPSLLLPTISFDDISYNLPVEKHTLLEITPGYPSAKIEVGPITVGAHLPTIDTSGVGGNAVVAEGKTTEPWVYASADFDRLLASATGNLVYLLGDPTASKDLLEGTWGKQDGIHVDYKLFDSELKAGLYATQRFEFKVTSIGIKMVSSYLGETKTGELGDVFMFSTPPTGDGEISVDTTYTLNGTLTNNTGVLGSYSLAFDALKFKLIVPDIINVTVPGLDIPTIELASTDPVYLYNNSQSLNGLDTASATYTVNYSEAAAANSSGTVTTLPDQDQVEFDGSGGDGYVYANDRGNTIYGGDGNDVIYGLAGGDVIEAGSGSDVVWGGSGDDVVTVTANYGESDVISGGTGTDSLSLDFSGTTNARLYLYSLDASGNFTSPIDSSSSMTTIQSMLTNADKFFVGYLFHDYGVTFDSIENLSLTASNDDDLLILQGTGTYNAKSGTDTLYADWSTSTTPITWNNLPNTTQTVNGSTVTSLERLLLTTGSGNDKLANTTFSTDDAFITGAGNDTLNGGAGNDVLTGGTGNDTYMVDTTNDVITELKYEGVDTIKSPISWTLQANLENLTLTGTTDINATGNGLANKLTGNSANNLLLGNAGKDNLNGGAGNDKLDGGTGNDKLTGGAGLDIFRFATKPSANIDTLTDFTVADDTIQLENAIFKKFKTPGELNASLFVNAPAAQDANDYLIYNPTTGALSYDADGNGAGVSVQIALLGVNMALTNADFVII